jgi:periplasmic divalent cation tolerance protein
MISEGTPVVLVLVTAPEQDVAESLVTTVVEERLAACGNIVPGVTSIYRWNGAVERAGEVLIIFKTVETLVQKLMERVVSLHPYEVPEALAVPVPAGLTSYVAWVTRNASD